MKEWAESWNDGVPAKRALVLMGSPGIGKTSSAEALARDMGWGIVEMNASDQRTGAAIRDVALRASYFNTFADDGTFMSVKDGKRKLIVLDEADSLFGNADRGAMPAINELIRTARQPVILIVNDFYALSRKSSVVKTGTIQVPFRKPTSMSVQKVLRRICRAEGVDIDDEAIAKIAVNANGDMRAAVRDLESLAYGNPKVTGQEASVLSGRAVRKDMYNLMSAIFRQRDPKLAYATLRECDEDPGMVSLWIEENIPYECHSTGDLVRCCERLSRADIYLGRVRRRMTYGLWSYANDMMTSGMVDALHSKTVTHDRFRFPTYLSKMSRSRAVRALRNSLCAKIAAMNHTSMSSVMSDCYDYYARIASVDREFRAMLVRDGGLEPEELGFLIDKKMDSKVVKQAFDDAFPKPEKEEKPKRARRAKKEEAATIAVPEKGPEKAEAKEPASAPAPEPAKEAEPAPGKEPPAGEQPAPKTQKSLFDF